MSNDSFSRRRPGAASTTDFETAFYDYLREHWLKSEGECPASNATEQVVSDLKRFQTCVDNNDGLVKSAMTFLLLKNSFLSMFR